MSKTYHTGDDGLDKEIAACPYLGDDRVPIWTEQDIADYKNKIDQEATDAYILNAAKLPSDAKTRKGIPIATGCVDYFPDALVAVAYVSRVGNDQHNPGKPLHWDRTKSQDEADALMRHFLERGTIDSDGIRHSAKVAWRALALLQKEIENERTT